jgi:hypothetical protein
MPFFINIYISFHYNSFESKSNIPKQLNKKDFHLLDNDKNEKMSFNQIYL